MLVCPLSGKLGKCGGGIPFAYISCEFVFHSLELDESCFRQVLLQKDFKFL